MKKTPFLTDIIKIQKEIAKEVVGVEVVEAEAGVEDVEEVGVLMVPKKIKTTNSQNKKSIIWQTKSFKQRNKHSAVACLE